MKVVHIIIGLNRGGAELLLKRLVFRQRCEQDIEHVVISLTDLGTIGNQMISAGISVYYMGMSSAYQVLFVFFKLRLLLKKIKPDIVHTWMYHADLLGGLAARSLGIHNVVWCIRSTDISKGGSKVTLVIRKLCALLSGWLPRIIVCAADASRKVHEAVGYSAEKMQVIPNGFDLDKLLVDESAGLSIRKELGVDDATFLIASVGRYNPVKDHKSFIEAAGKVAAKRGDVKFILVGRELEKSNEHLMSLIEATGHQKAFFLLGERNDVPACMQASNIFCLHSVSEGFPNVLGEAMAVGLPCVTTDVGDAAYLLNNPKWVVPPASPEKLTERLAALIAKSEAERSALGAASAKRILENFTLEAISKRYYKLYSSLVDSR